MTATTTRIAPPDLSREVLTRTAWKQGVIGSLNVLTAVLAVRLILLLAVAGAVALTWIALAGAEPMKLAALGLYLGGCVIPMVWLSRP